MGERVTYVAQEGIGRHPHLHWDCEIASILLGEGWPVSELRVLQEWGALEDHCDCIAKCELIIERRSDGLLTCGLRLSHLMQSVFTVKKG
jgi:hypothetical protein